MPRAMRRKDRETSEEQARELLARGEYGVLSTVGPDGKPYGVPLNYAYQQGEIYFHSAREGRKVDHLVPVASASFCVVGATEVLPDKFGTRYESVIASGEMRELEGDDKLRALSLFVEKYSSEYIAEGEAIIESNCDKTRVFAMRVDYLTGKRGQ